MLRRLRIYFTGFGIGLVMVYFMFFRNDTRDLDIWTPSQRILEEVRGDSVFLNSPALACYTNCLALDEQTMEKLWKDSEVSSLHPGGKPYRYLVSLNMDGINIEAELEKNTLYTLVSLIDKDNPTACECN